MGHWRVRLVDNKERSDRADAMVYAYSELGGDDDSDAVLVDILTDLRHWCDENELDFQHAHTMSEVHHEAEVQEEKEKERRHKRRHRKRARQKKTDEEVRAEVVARRRREEEKRCPNTPSTPN